MTMDMWRQSSRPSAFRETKDHRFRERSWTLTMFVDVSLAKEFLNTLWFY